MEKRLGKIERVSFGHGGYQEAMFGISFTFSGNDGWGVSDFKGNWDPEIIDSEHAQWTEEDRKDWHDETMRFISKLLKQAKVHDVYQLKGIPIEVTFDGNLLKEWRILEEVL